MQQNFLKFFLLFILSISALSCQKSFEYDVADIPYFEGLAEPPTGEGYQLHVPAFPVPAQYERELFIRVAIGNTEDIYVKGFHALCRPGTHHTPRHRRRPRTPARGCSRARPAGPSRAAGRSGPWAGQGRLV